MQLTEAQQSLLLHWQHMREKRGGLPARGDFRMQDLGRHVPDIIVMDILADPVDFRYRLIGTNAAEHLHMDYTGKSLRNLPGKGPGSTIWANMDETRQSREPRHLSVPYVGPHADFKKAVTLYLPLASDHQNADKLMLVTSFPPKEYKEMAEMAEARTA